MLRALLLALTVVVVATPAPAAQNACEVRCNQQASECLKACTGDPRDAQKPEEAGRLVSCLKACEARTTACKAACQPK